MSFPFLTSVDIGSIENNGGLSLKSISYLGTTVFAVSDSTLQQARSLLEIHQSLLDFYVNVTALESLEDVVSLLNSGVTKVIVSTQQLIEIEESKSIDLCRIIVHLPHSEANSSREPLAEVEQSLAQNNVGIHITVRSLKDLGDVYKQFRTPLRSFYVSLEKSDIGSLEAATDALYIPIIPSTALTVDPQDKSLIQVSSLIFDKATTDRADGLFTTLVTDEQGIALGLVYSNAESVSESLRTGRGVYQSRRRGLWYKGESSGDTQELLRIGLDCDRDCLRFTVRQTGKGFCHLETATCFGIYNGISRLHKTLQSRQIDPPKGSYTSKLWDSPSLLRAKIMEEAEELCGAESKSDIASEAADLIYFALTKCVGAGVSLEDVEKNLDLKSMKVSRRPGLAKGKWAEKEGLNASKEVEAKVDQDARKPESSTPKGDDKIKLSRYETASVSPEIINEVLKRPSQRSMDAIVAIVGPIVKAVRERGDAAILEYTHKFDKATSLTSPVLKAPFPKELMEISQETVEAIDISYSNILRFHAAQKEEKPLVVETMPGVICSRFSRAIERVGLYVPGGTAVLPSSALMLGVPAVVAGCQKIVIATPPRPDGSITPEIVYIAHKIGAESIVLAGGAQAIAALAYGTASVSKVDKILGPGNQFVTAAKMLVANDPAACVSIDMPAGPSEVLVIADHSANPAFVASDLLSQAEHGADSQVVLIAIAPSASSLEEIEKELHSQALALPRVDIVRAAIQHSVTLIVRNLHEALALSNQYAPEHLILQIADAQAAVPLVQNAGSVFIGHWTPESVGDYSAGVNHSLPTFGYARQYSGVNLASYVKHITSSSLSPQGLRNVGGAVMQLARVEQLEAHRRAVGIRLELLDREAEAKASVVG
ncbi:MAG: trifunctional histidinol dehydrogenase [Trizodia sp. TS-e1964]|nr:MAG: trifunctional histidinol dehydrogenase [Trizodia sp. TS-e1964]